MLVRANSRVLTLSLLLVVLVVLVLAAACRNSEDDGLVSPNDGSSSGEGSVPGDFWGRYKDIDGDGLIHHVADCTVCHDVFQISDNLRFIADTIATPYSGPKTVIFTSRQGPHSFADGDGVYDGVCEVCHTGTIYHRNDAAGDHTHYAGFDCVWCHTHAIEFSPSGGAAGAGHSRHLQGGGGGLALACDDCHTSDFSSFQDGQPFATTTVCDACHSPGGVIDGVDDPAVGARTNWVDGVYEGGALKAGKERWCAGCHDLGSSVVNGVTAPPVAGDGTWGFFATGHGQSGAVNCADCHDVTSPHFDGQAHSYSAASGNYQTAFRLADVDGQPPLLVPRTDFDWDDPYSDPPYFDLCFSCHDKYALLGSPAAPVGPYNISSMLTNFRSDSSVVIPDGSNTDIALYSVSGAISQNSHYTHLGGPPHFYDSDRDGNVDSYGTCVACHNVHGSSSPLMMRDGKLEAMEPGLNFSYVRYDRHDPPQGGCGDPIVMTSDGVTGPNSYGGVMRASSGPASNGYCNFCHCGGAGTDDPEYVINCFDPDCVDYYREYVTPPAPTPPSP